MKRILIITLVILTILTLIAEHTGTGGHGHEHWWNRVPGFFIIFGFLGCLGLIHVAKTLGKVFLSKKEDYYHDQ